MVMGNGGEIIILERLLHLDWFKLHFTENNGMAFGLQFGGISGKIILSSFRVIAVFFIGWYLSRLYKTKAHYGLIVSMSLILAGAIGNIIDSVFYGVLFSESYPGGPLGEFMPKEGGYASLLQGKVVDMLYFPMFEFYWPDWVPRYGGRFSIFFRPVFNISDTAITTGVITILLFQRRFFKKASPTPDSVNSGANSDTPKLDSEEKKDDHETNESIASPDQTKGD